MGAVPFSAAVARRFATCFAHDQREAVVALKEVCKDLSRATRNTTRRRRMATVPPRNAASKVDIEVTAG
jgi:hypothetical protein